MLVCINNIFVFYLSKYIQFLKIKALQGNNYVSLIYTILYHLCVVPVFSFNHKLQLYAIHRLLKYYNDTDIKIFIEVKLGSDLNNA